MCVLGRGSDRPSSSLLMPVQFPGRAFQRGSQDRNLLPGQVEVVFVDGFVYSGNDDRRVTGVLTGSINRMTKPRPVGQALRQQQRPLRSQQSFIQSGGITR